MKKKLVLSCGAAVLTTLGLGAGPASAESGSNPLQCNKTYANVTINNDVQVPANGVCILQGVKVTGGVSVGTNGYFEANHTAVAKDVLASSALTVYVHGGSSIGGSVGADKTAQVFVFGSSVGGSVGAAQAVVAGYGHFQVCGATVGGSLGAALEGPDVLVGDPAGGCAADTIGGDLALYQNSTDNELYLMGNKIGGKAYVQKNLGTSDKRVQNNSGGSTLNCSGNAAPFTGSPNGSWGSFSGQCSG